MAKRKLIWIVPVLIYATFVVWYTDFGGPLRDQEVDQFVSTLNKRNADPATVKRLEKFLRADTGKQFLMINALDFSDNPPFVEGAAPGETARQLMGRYMEHMNAEFVKRACHPVIMGRAANDAIDIVGISDAEQWTDGALIRYRSRRAFMEIVLNPETVKKHRFKQAALEKTIAFPIEPGFYPGDPRLLLGLILLVIAALLDIAFFGRRRS